MTFIDGMSRACVLVMRFQVSLLTGLVLLSVIAIPGAALPIREHAATPYVDRALPVKDSPPGALGMSAASNTTAVRAQALADVLRVQSAAFMGCAPCAETITATPKPTSLLLFGITLAGIGLILRRRLPRAGVVNRT